MNDILHWLLTNIVIVAEIISGLITILGGIGVMWHKVIKPFGDMQNKQNNINTKLEELDNRMENLENKNKEIDKTNNLLLHSNYAILTVLKTQTSDDAKTSKVVDDALQEFVDFQINKT